jgi:site-specific DNA-cytosine methylase
MMGFPDDFDTSPPHDGMFQYGHIYKVLGNAVVPPVVEAIGREMLRLMEHVKVTLQSDEKEES